MRLVILTYDFAPNNGGIARLCNEIHKQCMKTDTDYLVVTNVPGDTGNEKVVRITGRRGIVEYRILRYLRKNLRKGDVILTGTFHPDGLIALLTGFPTYFLGHGAEFLPGGSFIRRIIWPVYRRIILAKPKGVISNSHYTAGLVKLCSKKANVIPVPLAVDENAFHPTLSKYNDGKLHLCSISRLEKFKAQDFVIKTIANLPEAYRSCIHFEIGGKGPYKAELEQLVKNLGLENQVSFLGFVADNDLCDFYSRNNLFILTTREDKTIHEVEGFGLVFTEAQACGTPCIGSKSGGIPDAIEDGNGGWLINQDSEVELKTLLMDLIDNPSKLQEQSIMARQRMEADCTWDKYFKSLCEIIELK